MKDKKNPVTIVIAEDDEDDYILTRDAFAESRLINNLIWVHDGEELLDYLTRHGEYAAPESSPRPALILLDLNMPRMDGREALKRIKSDASLRRIPVVVLTTSRAEEDIVRSYDLGVNSFIQKPVSFSDFANALRLLGAYWLEVVALPPEIG
jgi:CheY-like chemotaxis protein